MIPPELFGIQQVFTESLAQIHIHVSKRTLPLDKIVEMLIDKRPFLVFAPAHLLEIGQKIGFHLGLVQEAELLVNQRLHPDTTNRLRLVQHIVVELTFHFVFRVCINVNPEILPTAHLHRFRVTDCRIIIQIQRDAVIPNRSLTNGYFCTSVLHTVFI